MMAAADVSAKSPSTAGANTSDFRHLLSELAEDTAPHLKVCLKQPIPVDWVIGFYASAWHDASADRCAAIAVKLLRASGSLLQAPEAHDQELAHILALIYAILAGLSHRSRERMTLSVLADIGNGSVIEGGAWLSAVVARCASILQGSFTGECKDSALCLLVVFSCIDPECRESVYLDSLRHSGPALLQALAAGAESRPRAPSTANMGLLIALLGFQGRWGGDADSLLVCLRGGLCAQHPLSGPAPLKSASQALLAAGHDLIAHCAACTPSGTAVLRSVASSLQGGGYNPPVTAAALAARPLSAAAAVWTSAGTAVGSFGAALSTAVAFALGSEGSSTATPPSSGFHPLGAGGAAGAGAADTMFSRHGVTLRSGEGASLLGRGGLQMQRNCTVGPVPMTHISRCATLLLAVWDTFVGHTAGLRSLADVSSWRGREGGPKQPVTAPPLLKLLLSICSYAVQSWDDAAAALGLAVLQRLTEGLQHGHMARRSAQKLSRRAVAKATRRSERAAQAVRAATQGGRLTVQGAMLELAQFGEAGPQADAPQGTGEGASEPPPPPPHEAEFAVPTCLLSTSLPVDSCQVVLFARQDVVHTLGKHVQADPAATQTEHTALVPAVATHRPLLGAVLCTATAGIRLHLQPRQLHLSLLRRACQVAHRVLYLVLHTIPRHVPGKRASKDPPKTPPPARRGDPSTAAQPALPSEAAAATQAAPATSWWGGALSSIAGAAAAAAPVMQAAASSTRAALGMGGTPPPGSSGYSQEGIAAAQRVADNVQGSGHPRGSTAGVGSGVGNGSIPPLPTRQGGGSPASDHGHTELQAQYAHLMLHIDWLPLLQALLRLMQRCLRLDLWGVGIEGGCPKALRGESRRLVQLVFLLLDMLLQAVDGAARLPAFYEVLRCEEQLRAAVGAFAVGSGEGGEGGVEDIPPRMQACLTNLRNVLSSVAQVPGIAALRLGAAGAFDGNLTVEAVKAALQDAAPWDSLARSDRVMDAYTPLSDTAERPLLDSVVGALAADARASLKLKL